jgi:putative ABC transport system permease protein
MGIPIVRGRSFTDRDTGTAALVAIVDETLVRKFFPNADPIGKRISFESHGHGPDSPPIWREIVGVVRPVRHYALVGGPPYVQVYAPFDQLPIWFRDRRPTMALVARTALEPQQLAASIRQAVGGIDPAIPVYGIQTMEAYVAQAMEQPRISMALLGLFGGLALVLSSLGIYGVLSYSVSRRTQEIGIRMALGATRRDVMRLIIGHGMALTVAGLIIGFGASWAITRWLSALLVGVSPHDPVTFVAIALLLATTAFVASYLPGRRATRVDPVITLRYE